MSKGIRNDRDVFRIVSSAGTAEWNPCFRLFYSALRAHRVELVGTFEASRRWLHRHWESFDVLHFHWPEWIVRSQPGWLRMLQATRGGWRIGQRLSPAVPWTRIHEDREFLKDAIRHRKLIVWTCHNIEAHEDVTWPVRAAYHLLGPLISRSVTTRTRVPSARLFIPPAAGS